MAEIQGSLMRREKSECNRKEETGQIVRKKNPEKRAWIAEKLREREGERRWIKCSEFNSLVIL